jgi:hypothetical protein
MVAGRCAQPDRAHPNSHLHAHASGDVYHHPGAADRHAAAPGYARSAATANRDAAAHGYAAALRHTHAGGNQDANSRSNGHANHPPHRHAAPSDRDAYDGANRHAAALGYAQARAHADAGADGHTAASALYSFRTRPDRGGRDCRRDLGRRAGSALAA